MTGKRQPGRPLLGAQPLTPAQRKQRSLARRLQEGGSVLSLVLSPEESRALRSGMRKAGATVKRDYVASLILKHR